MIPTDDGHSVFRLPLPVVRQLRYGKILAFEEG